LTGAAPVLAGLRFPLARAGVTLGSTLVRSIAMNFSRPAAGALLASLLLLSACERPEIGSERETRTTREARREASKERESAPSVAQARDIENFDSIELRGAAELVVNVGPATSLNLDGSERTLKQVETHVRGDTLVINVSKSRGWFGDGGHLKVSITTPKLTSLESNGAGDIEIHGLNGGEQKLELAGAHNVKADGHLEKLKIELSGAGNVDYRNVVVADAKVTVNGAGNVEVHATQSLRAEVNGVGAVRYSGDPAKVESELHGLGAITRRDGNEQAKSDWEADVKGDDKATAKEPTLELEK
jgi:hypothetical protein